MSRTPTADDWQTFYREAILESDPAKVPGLIALAYQVVQRRVFELWYMGDAPTRERHELDNALYILDLLRKFGPVQEVIPPASDPDQRSAGESSEPGSSISSSTAKLQEVWVSEDKRVT